MTLIELTECPNCKSKHFYKSLRGIYYCSDCGEAFLSEVVEDPFFEEPQKKKYKTWKPWWWHRKKL